MNDALHKIFIEELQDAYDAEKQIIQALPEMIDAASDASLQTSLQEHLEETQGQVERLEEVANTLNATLQTKTCMGMAGILQEGAAMLSEGSTAGITDVLITMAAAKVEHYEIATYTSLVNLAKTMDLSDAVELLEETLDEEQAALDTLETAASGGLFTTGLADKAEKDVESNM